MNTTKFDFYELLGWGAMVVAPVAPAIFFGWKGYEAILVETGLAWLAVPGGLATSLGLEVVGVFAGHTAIEFYQRQDRRWWVAAAIMLAYVGIGTYELWANSIGRVTFLISALVYVLVGLRHNLTTATVAASQERAETRQDAAEMERLRLQYAHEERLARIEAQKASTERAPAAPEPAQSGHKCEKCDRSFGSQPALNAHRRHCQGAVVFSTNGTH